MKHYFSQILFRDNTRNFFHENPHKDEVIQSIKSIEGIKEKDDGYEVIDADFSGEIEIAKDLLQKSVEGLTYQEIIDALNSVVERFLTSVKWENTAEYRQKFADGKYSGSLEVLEIHEQSFPNFDIKNAYLEMKREEALDFLGSTLCLDIDSMEFLIEEGYLNSDAIFEFKKVEDFSVNDEEWSDIFEEYNNLTSISLEKLDVFEKHSEIIRNEYNLTDNQENKLKSLKEKLESLLRNTMDIPVDFEKGKPLDIAKWSEVTKGDIIVSLINGNEWAERYNSACDKYKENSNEFSKKTRDQLYFYLKYQEQRFSGNPLSTDIFMKFQEMGHKLDADYFMFVVPEEISGIDAEDIKNESDYLKHVYGLISQHIKLQSLEEVVIEGKSKGKSYEKTNYNFLDYEPEKQYWDGLTADQFLKDQIGSLEQKKSELQQSINKINTVLNANNTLKPFQKVRLIEDKEHLQRILNFIDEEQKNYTENGIDEFNKFPIEQQQIARKYYEEQRNWMNENINSRIYRRRLKRELRLSGKSTKEARSHQQDRSRHLNDLQYSVTENGGSIVFDDMQKKYKFELPYLEDDDGFKWKEDNPYTAVHEFTHGVTHGSDGLTQYAKDMYTQSFFVPNDFEKYPFIRVSDNAKQDFIDYYNNPSERDARKNVMERELEDMGIKKVKQRFTNEHYDKIMNLYEPYAKIQKELYELDAKYNEIHGSHFVMKSDFTGYDTPEAEKEINEINQKKEEYIKELDKLLQFSKNSLQFIEMTIKDPKIWKQIFNRIA
jgi:hypothetical protein